MNRQILKDAEKQFITKIILRVNAVYEQKKKWKSYHSYLNSLEISITYFLLFKCEKWQFTLSTPATKYTTFPPPIFINSISATQK